MSVGDAYDAMAELYASLFLGEVEGDTNAKDWFARLAGLVTSRAGVVADLGCGPGHVTRHLHDLGLNAIGYDISPGQIEQAEKAFPNLRFHVGDLTALDADDSSLGGIVSRYSLIHLEPFRLDEAFEEWMRVLEPGAPVLISFFGSLTAEAHRTPFDHKVVTAYELFPETIANQLRAAGFLILEIGLLPPTEGGRPFDQATILATKPDA